MKLMDKKYLSLMQFLREISVSDNVTIYFCCNKITQFIYSCYVGKVVKVTPPSITEVNNIMCTYYKGRFGGLVVSMLASGTRVCGFKPGRCRRIFSGENILSMPSFGREVKLFALCRRFAAC
jgi:hypothetical protein